MPVVIENLSPPETPDDQPHQYRLRINRNEVVQFRHRRDEGLAECLRRAADAVDAAGEGSEVFALIVERERRLSEALDRVNHANGEGRQEGGR